MKSTILIFLFFYGSEVNAFPSLNQEASVATKPPTSEELKHMINETISQVLKDILMTTTTPVADLISKEKIASAVTPWQLTAAQNLTKYLEELVKSENNPTQATTPVLASAYDKRFTSIEQSLQNLTDSMKTLESTVHQLRATKTLAPSLCGSFADYEYSSQTKRCYKLHTEEMDWPAAQAACRAEEGYLAVLNNNEEARIVGDINLRITNNPFIGVYKDPAGQWKTVTGETFENAGGFEWDDYEPSVGDQWRFATLGDYTTIVTRLATETFPFICEKVPMSNLQ